MYQRQRYWIKMQIIMLKFFVVSDSKRFLSHLMLAVYLEVTELLFEHIQSQENDLLWFQCCRGLEEEDQGYIARLYGYFDNEGYGSEKLGQLVKSEKMVFIANLLRLGNQLHIQNWDIRNYNYKSNAWCAFIPQDTWFFVILIVVLMTLYFKLSQGGTTFSSTKGILFSLFPSTILSMSVWGIKRRFFSGKLKNMRGERSVSTEQEDLQDAEQNTFLFSVVESGEEQTSHQTKECQRDAF